MPILDIPKKLVISFQYTKTLFYPPGWMCNEMRFIGNAAVADQQEMISKSLSCVSVRAMRPNSRARLPDMLPPLRERTVQEMSEDTNSLAEAESW